MSGPILWLEMASGRQPFRLAAGRQVAGRANDVDIRIDSERVSLRHLELRWRDGVLTAVDLGTATGTTVNGRAITEPSVLLDGDEVRLGPVRLEVEIDRDAPSGNALDDDRPEPVSPTRSPIGLGIARASRQPIFIIRHHRDGELASRLARTLEQAGWRVTMADAEILGGREWVAQSVDGLKDAVAAVVLLTGRAAGSEWVARQVREAILARTEILTVVADGATPSGDLRVDLEPTERVEIETAARPGFGSAVVALNQMLDGGATSRGALRTRRLGRTLVAAGALGVVVGLLWLAAAGRPVAGVDPDPTNGPTKVLEPFDPLLSGIRIGDDADDAAGPGGRRGDVPIPVADGRFDEAAGSLAATAGFVVLALSVTVAAVGEFLRRGPFHGGF